LVHNGQVLFPIKNVKNIKNNTNSIFVILKHQIIEMPIEIN